MLPNNLIYDSQGKDNTLIKKYKSDKVIHILSYLDLYTNRLGKSIFSIKDIIVTSGLIPKTGKNNSIEQFKNILVRFQEDNIIQFNQTDKIDLSKVKLNDMIKCEFNMPIVKDIDESNINFFCINHDKYLDLMDNYTGKLNRITLLKIYMYIVVRLSRRENIIVKDENNNDYKLVNDINVHGGKAECFYEEYNKICRNLEIAKDTLNVYLKELNKLGLIFYDNIGLVKKDKYIHPANNVYCIDKDELKEALKQSALYYQEEGYKILGKKSTDDIKKINGLKGKIESEKSKGKDTHELENKLERLEKKNNKRVKENIDDT